LHALCAFISSLLICYTTLFFLLPYFFRTFTAPEATQVGEHTITQKHLYFGLFAIGIPMFLWAGPFATFFSILFLSMLCIFVHASLLEPGVESDYATVQDQV
jgi:hypothetical protein